MKVFSTNLPNRKKRCNFFPKHQRFFLSTYTLQYPDANLIEKSNSPTSSSRQPSSSSQCDVISSNKLIVSFIRSNDLDSALRVFNNMRVKTVVSWNSILAGYVKRGGKTSEAQELFDKIPEPDSFSYNTMLTCYLQNSGVEKARTFFEHMPIKDTASWNTMISGFARNGEMDKACKLFSMMPEKNAVTWNAMISGYADCGDMYSAAELFNAASVKDVVAWTAMITGYMKLGKIELAKMMFEEMPTKNLVTWNAMIAGFVDNCRAEDGLKLFKQMLQLGTRPNPSSLSSVLLGCSELSALQFGRQVHQLVSKFPLCNSVTAGTSLISMYCKCGDLEHAWKLFIEIPEKDVVAWNAMISGYAQHGAGEKALILYDSMKDQGVRPDWITSIAVLKACNHAGFVDFGFKYFHSMGRDYGVELKPDHYACMVDLLGRAGRLVEAVDLIKKMPFKPHAALFGTLLGACRMHKNIDIAEFAANSLLELDPTCATAYVQLANVYAAMNRWDHVARIRRSMKTSKIVKSPGYSWIEIKSAVHQFRSSDRVHPELVFIHEKLNELDKKMKVAGYVPDLEFALHDVEEEQKERLLLWHSEKLAIAYGLLKLPSQSPVRIFKNLRTCGDCHSATKYLSAIEKREIVIRDTSRFHHFKDGICSCGDYW